VIKRLLKLAVLVAVIGAIAYVLRDHLVPAPEGPTTAPPKFRVAPEHHATEAEEAAGEVVDEVPVAPLPSDDLTDVKGIGPVYFGRLVEAGITTLADLATATPADVAGWAGVTEDTAVDWIDQAKNLSG
jgi:predicted flap endonuclease-1-like 5' DNA nuclease